MSWQITVESLSGNKPLGLYTKQYNTWYKHWKISYVHIFKKCCLATHGPIWPIYCIYIKNKTGCYRNVVQIPMRDSVSVMGHVHSVCLCLFKPVQVIWVHSRKAHVVTAWSSIARRAHGARNTYFIRGLTNPVPPVNNNSNNTVNDTPMDKMNHTIFHTWKCAVWGVC